MTALDTMPAAPIVRLKLAVRGAVQGVGFRPFVYRLANELGLTGWVNNSPQGVFIEVEGGRIALEQFRQRLETDQPPRSCIQSCESSWLDALGHEVFEIRASEAAGEKTTLVLPDIATCPDCLREIFDPANRRYHYPFTNCTNCGPRFSIIEALPYDRASTSMRAFKMCPACQAEYEDPGDRRFHAQPNACPVCGPRLEFWDRRTGVAPVSNFKYNGDRRDACPTNNDALLAAADAISHGQIVAVKGIGGFHLLVDARSDEAVRRLRQRKHREEKPFALMFPCLESVKTMCAVSALEERRLLCPEAPIVLLQRRSDGVLEQWSNDRWNDRHPISPSLHHSISPSLAPKNPNLGVMLPSNPVYHLLMAELGFPVVATSGNLSDEPLCTDEREAVERLRDIADVFLVHNRPIVRHIDDSIVRVMLNREMMLRRARGYAPLPIQLRSAECGVRNDRTVLAVGAHLKNTVALSVGDQVFISQHIGDLETEQATSAFRRVIGDFETLFDTKPGIIAADLHPDYLSTKVADEVGRNELPLGPDAQPRGPAKIGVQHHVAHVLSCVAENEVELPVLGVAWDGTGYGLDGTIWGGEFFLVTDDQIERVACLRPFPLPGGDAAVKEPRRAALGLLHELANGDDNLSSHLRQKVAGMFSAAERVALTRMLARGVNSPRCSSVGRLFDAVAALVGLRHRLRFEGQAAMELEFARNGVDTDEAYELPIAHRQSPLQLDWAGMIASILTDVNRGVSVGEISAKFHNALAEGIVSLAKEVGERRVALSGGCFQNRYLTERAVARLREAGFQPYWHQRVPTNDGGIALGQIVAARRELAGRGAAFTPLRPSRNGSLSIPNDALLRSWKQAEARAPIAAKRRSTMSPITHQASR